MSISEGQAGPLLASIPGERKNTPTLSLQLQDGFQRLGKPGGGTEEDPIPLANTPTGLFPDVLTWPAAPVSIPECP